MQTGTQLQDKLNKLVHSCQRIKEEYLSNQHTLEFMHTAYDTLYNKHEIIRDWLINNTSNTIQRLRSYQQQKVYRTTFLLGTYLEQGKMLIDMELLEKQLATEGDISQTVGSSSEFSEDSVRIIIDFCLCTFSPSDLTQLEGVVKQFTHFTTTTTTTTVKPNQMYWLTIVTKDGSIPPDNILYKKLENNKMQVSFRMVSWSNNLLIPLSISDKTVFKLLNSQNNSWIEQYMAVNVLDPANKININCVLKNTPPNLNLSLLIDEIYGLYDPDFTTTSTP